MSDSNIHPVDRELHTAKDEFEDGLGARLDIEAGLAEVFRKGQTVNLIPELGPLTVHSDVRYWGIRMPDGSVQHAFTDRAEIFRQFQVHLNAVTVRGLRQQFLAGARIVQHRRLFLATQWEEDPEGVALIAELFPVAEDGDGQ